MLKNKINCETFYESHMLRFYSLILQADIYMGTQYPLQSLISCIKDNYE